MAAFLGHAIYGALFRTDLTMPESIAGSPRIHSADATRFEDRAQQSGEQEHARASAAVYGSSSPEYFLIAIANPSSSPDENFEAYARGFASGSGGQTTVDVAGRATTEGDGTTFICADVTGQLSGSLCMWQTDDVSGYVHAIGKEQPEALAFTREARSLVGA